MRIHLVYEEEYMDQLRTILESAGHTITDWDYSLSQFADFSARKEINSDLALIDGQAGVISKKEIIESLENVRRNLPNLRLIVIFMKKLEKDEAFISKLLTFSIYDMYFKDEYDIDELETWIKTPKNFANYNIEIEDIQGDLIETEKPKLQLQGAERQPIPPANTITLPSFSSVMAKIPSFPSFPSIHLSKKKTVRNDEIDLVWNENGKEDPAQLVRDPIDRNRTADAADPTQLLGKVIWFWSCESSLSTAQAASRYAQKLAQSIPVLLLDGNLVNPGLRQEYDCSVPGWERSWLEKTPGIPPKNFYAKENLTVWLLKEPVEALDIAEMWDVAIYHIRTARQVIIIDGGAIQPPDEADYNFPMGQQAQELSQKYRDEQESKTQNSGNDAPQTLLLPRPDAAACQEAIQKVLRDEPAYIVMVDADGLKGINDRYGHAAGTAYLTEIWNRLHQAYPNALWNRYGGDEFYGVLESYKANVDEVLTKSEGIRGMTNIQGRDILVACSIGVYEAQKGESAVASMAMADHAMYDIKRIHHGGIKTFSAKHSLALIGDWPEEWITVPVTEGWRVLVYSENVNPAQIPVDQFLVAHKRLTGFGELWIPQSHDVSELIEKIRKNRTIMNEEGKT